MPCSKEYQDIHLILFEGDAETTDDGIELATARFIVKKTGWHLDGSESVMLIKRFNQDLVGNDVSPSNFKPIAGASLLWTYYNDHRAEKWPGKFLRWLEPSFGINVSYVDFLSSETFEVGAGPIVGLWQNRLFLTAGYNFNVEGQSPFYMGIGFSFFNVVDKIKVNGNLNQ